MSFHAITCLHHTDAERRETGSPCPVCAHNERTSLRAQLATLTATLAQREAEAVEAKKLANDLALKIEHDSHDQALWHQVRIVLVPASSTPYNGLIEVAHELVAARDTALARVRELEAAVGEVTECVKLILTNWPPEDDGGAHFSDPVPIGVKSCRHWLEKHAAAARAAGTGEEGAGV